MDSTLLYKKLPVPFQTVLKQVHQRIVYSPETISADFIDEFFRSRNMYESLFEDGLRRLEPLVSDALSEYSEIVSQSTPAVWAGVSLTRAAAYYAFTKHRKPDVIIETGVCNGVSSLALLAAMDDTNHGCLYSIDYPVYTEAELPEVVEGVKEEGEPFSAIPKNKSPGWLVPDSLHDRWELRIGRSQRELPRLVNELDGTDVFIHDSEHTFPCMMFEYEIAWEWLNEGGVLFSDDIHANDAFDRFTDLRADRFGPFGKKSGFAIR